MCIYHKYLTTVTFDVLNTKSVQYRVWFLQIPQSQSQQVTHFWPHNRIQWLWDRGWHNWWKKSMVRDTMKIPLLEILYPPSFLSACPFSQKQFSPYIGAWSKFVNSNLFHGSTVKWLLTLVASLSWSLNINHCETIVVIAIL